MFSTMKEAQDATVLTIAKLIPEEWERVVVNFEMEEEEDGGVTHDVLAFYIVKKQAGGFSDKELKLTDELQAAFTELNRASLKTNKQYWTTCDLVLDSNGKYEMKFSYEPPKRINGILDEDSYYRFGKKYLEEYTASRK